MTNFSIYRTCNLRRKNLDSSATFIPKRELSSFTPEEIKQSLHKERDNLISTGTLEAIPKNEWNSIPKNKQITSHTFTEVKSDNTLKSRTVAHGNKQTPETYTIFSYGTIHHVTINLLLVKALNMNIIPYQIDIGHAFLDGKIMKLWAHASLFRSPLPYSAVCFLIICIDKPEQLQPYV